MRSSTRYGHRPAPKLVAALAVLCVALPAASAEARADHVAAWTHGLALLAQGPAAATGVEEVSLSVNGRAGMTHVGMTRRDGALCLDLATLIQYLGLAFQSDQTGVITVSFFGRTLVMQQGSNEARGPNGAVSLPCAPFADSGATYLPVRAVAEAFGMAVSERPGAMDVSMKPAVILGVRYSEDDDKFRAVVDLAEPTPFFAVASPQVISVGLVTTGGFVPPNKSPVRRDSRGQLIDEGPPKLITLEATGGVLGSGVTIENLDRTFVRISAHGKYGVDAPRFYTLAGPDRVVLDFPKRWERTSVADVGEGTRKTWFSFGTSAGPVVAYALLAHVGPGASLAARLAVAGDVSRTRAPLSQIARNAGALAAVNGGYFAPDSGDPIGLLIRDGEWIRMPYARRTALVIGQDGRLSMGNLGATAEVNIGGRRCTVAGLNEWLPGEGECVKVVTPRWGGSWPCISGQVCLQVRNGAVTAVARPTGNGVKQDVSIPADGYLVTGCGQAVATALGGVRNGTTVTFAAALDPAVSGVRDVLGAGPRLVAGGRYQNTSAAEQFKTDITVGRSPRTAVGITASGDLLLVVVDGRQPGYSVGMTQAELATLMIRLGAVDAMAMDSGGSAMMYADGKVLNSPSDGRERPIPNALVVVPAGR